MNTDQASAEAIHKTKNAQQAIEVARQMQLDKVVVDTARQTKESLLEGLREVFGDSDAKDPEQMKVLVRRIPILCTNIVQMHGDIADIKDNQRWANRLIIGGIVSILGSIFVGVIVMLITTHFK